MSQSPPPRVSGPQPRTSRLAGATVRRRLSAAGQCCWQNSVPRGSDYPERVPFPTYSTLFLLGSEAALHIPSGLLPVHLGLRGYPIEQHYRRLVRQQRCIQCTQCRGPAALAGGVWLTTSHGRLSPTNRDEKVMAYAGDHDRHSSTRQRSGGQARRGRSRPPLLHRPARRRRALYTGGSGLGAGTP